MKLIWHHNNRTGGTTMESLWHPDIDIFHCDKNAYKKGEEYNYKRIQEADIVHLHSNGICPLFVRYFKKKPEQWQNLLSQSLRLSVVREPISKFESEWGSYVERKNGKMLPHVPNFNLDALNSKQSADLDVSGFYHNQDKSCQLNINQWMEVYRDIHGTKLPSPNFDFKSEYKSNGLNEVSPFYNGGWLSEGWSQNTMNFFLGTNRQYTGMAQNLCEDFILKPRKPFLIDILLANENLDMSLAGLVYANKTFKEYTIFRDRDNSLQEIHETIKSLRTHSRSSQFKSNSEFKLSSVNRQAFYLLNRKEYILWQSAMWSGSKFLRSL